MGTPRENFLRTLRRQGFDSVPVDMNLCPSQVEAFKKRFGHENYADYFGFAHESVGLPSTKTFADGKDLYRREALPDDVRIDDWGVGHSKGSEYAVHMTRMHHPLKGADSLDEVKNYPMPTISNDKVETVRSLVADMHKRDHAACGHMACTIWETSWYLRSMEELMVDMMTGDEKATVLLDKVLHVSTKRAEGFARAGVDVLCLGDDIGTQNAPMIAVDMWEELLKPRLRAVIHAAKKIKPDILVWYHSCGFVTPFVEGLIDAGIDILNPIQPECMDFDEVYDIANGRLSFWGCVGTQHVLPFGTPGQVKEKVRHYIKKCGEKGGIVIGPTHLVEPEVPWENLVALADAAKEFAR